MKSVGIVIPCYNEGKSLNALIEKCGSSFHPRIKYLLVNNGSTDNTKEILAQQKLPQNVEILHIRENKGYGFGILQGLKCLEDDFVGWTHADLQSDPSDILKFISCIDSGADFMKGTRVGRPLSDRFFTGGMSLLISMLFLKRLHDINAQPTILRKSMLNYWQSPPDDYALDLYAYLIAVRLNSRIQRKQVTFGPRNWGSSHWNNGFLARMRFIRRTLKFALRMRLNLI